MKTIKIVLYLLHDTTTRIGINNDALQCALIWSLEHFKIPTLIDELNY